MNTVQVKCDNETEKVSYGKVKVNSVLRCKNNECGIVIDRDVMAVRISLKYLNTH